MHLFSDDTAALTKALSSFQGEITDPKKSTAGYGYRYATLDQVLSIVRPLLAKNGLALTQMISTRWEGEREWVRATTRVMHESGEWMESTLSLPVEQMKGMSHAQAVGSIITYARRYSIQAAVGIAAEEDTDAAMPKVEKKAKDVEDFI